jgi:hypothetical protein
MVTILSDIGSPMRRLYPPACKPYGLEAELEAEGLSPCVFKKGDMLVNDHDDSQ